MFSLIAWNYIQSAAENEKSYAKTKQSAGMENPTGL